MLWRAGNRRQECLRHWQKVPDDGCRRMKDASGWQQTIGLMFAWFWGAFICLLGFWLWLAGRLREGYRELKNKWAR